VNQQLSRAVLFALLLACTGFPPPSQAADLSALTPEMVIDRLSTEFIKIKDIRTDYTLETNLFLLGCGGTLRQKGYGLYKYPDNLKIVMNGITYIFKGNQIKRIDAERKITYWRFANSPDFSIGYTPRLMSHNFYLTIVKSGANEIALEGLPKPGVLKNVNKVTFYVDPVKWLLKRLDISFRNKSLSGYADVNYEKIDGIWAPVGTAGKSAFQASNNALIGFGFRLRGENMQVNSGISDSDFK